MPITNGEVDELCSTLREVLKPRKGEAPILARALRWINHRAPTLNEHRLCNALLGWTLAAGNPMARIAFAQLRTSVGLAPGRYSDQRLREWLKQSIANGLIRRVANRGGQATLYRLAFVDELLAERHAESLLRRLRALDEPDEDNEPF